MTIRKPRMAFAGELLPRSDSPGEGARYLPVWRGKPLVTDASALCWLGEGHRCLDHSSGPPIHVGEIGDVSGFACDISDWQPEGIPETGPDTILDQAVQHHPDAPAGSGFVNLRSVMTTLSGPEAQFIARAKSLLAWHARNPFCAGCGNRSRMSEDGVHRVCDHCRAVHFCRTDPVVIMLVTSGNSVLLGRAHDWPDRMFSLLAGFMEPGETIEAAVRRETFEEAGIQVGKVGYVASQAWPFPSSLMIGCVGQAESTEIRLDSEELAAALWMTREDMLEVWDNPDADIRPPRPGSIAEYLIWKWLGGRPM